MGSREGGIIIFNFQDVIAREDICQMVTGASFFPPRPLKEPWWPTRKGKRDETSEQIENEKTQGLIIGM